MSETQHATQYFQWVKGETAGKVVEWNGQIITTPEGKPALLFADGTNALEELMNDYILEVASPNEWDLILIPEPPKGAQPPQQRPASPQYNDNGQGDVVVAAPPPGWKPGESVAATSNVAAQPSKVEEKVSPIFKLLADSKKSPLSVEALVEIEIPSTELMKVLADSYENGEDEVLKYLASTINIDELKAKIASQIWQHAINPVAKKSRKKTNETA